MPLDAASPASLLDLPDPKDDLAVAFAVRRCAEQLRASSWEPESLVPVVDKLRALAKDPSPRVRQSVAEASPYLPEPVFRELHPALAADRSPYVRDAASRAERRRSALRREAAESAEHDARVDRWYREIERKGARALARRIASHETEYFVRRMVHEATAAFGPFEAAAKALRAGLAAPEVDRVQCASALDRLEERFAFFQHVLETGRSHALAIVPDFRQEKVGDLIADEVALLRSRLPDRAERLDVDVSGVDRKLVVEVDPSFLRQAIANVLKNAVEAYDAMPGTPIRVRLTATLAEGGADAAIAVADFGCGIDDDALGRAFVPFGSRKPGGTGFGLFIARRVVQSVHGGELALESRLGEGTTVTMTLPLRQEAPKTKKRAAREARA